MTVNDGECGEVKVTPAEKKEAVQAPQKKITAKKGPQAAAARRAAKGRVSFFDFDWNFQITEARANASETKEESEEESESTELVAKDDSESEDEEEKTWKKLQKRSKITVLLI